MDILKFEAAVGPGAPPGAWPAVFVGIEPTENQYGKGLTWKWQVSEGEHKGKTLTRITGERPSPANACGKMLVAMLGKTPTPGESVALATLIGKRYLCIVAKGAQGGCRVETVTPLPAAA